MRGRARLVLVLALASGWTSGCSGGCRSKSKAKADESPAREAAGEVAPPAGGKQVPGEVRASLKKLYDGARAYYQAPPANAAQERTFPATIAMTPEAGACCKQADRTCQPDAAAWEAPTWRALAFSMDGPHQYSYEFTSTGAGKSARFVIRATGDLDCDGTFATFEVTGFPDKSGNVSPHAPIQIGRPDE